MTTIGGGPLLLVRGLGGPDASLLSRSLSGTSTVTLYGRLPGDEERWAREAPLLRSLGPVLEVPFSADAATAAHAARGYGVAGVVTFSELGLSLAAEIADRLGLSRHHSIETTAMMRDKLAQRRMLAERGVPVPRHAIFATGICTDNVENVDMAARAAAEVGFPAVLKPLRGAGSGYTYRVRSLPEALARYSTAIEVMKSSGSAVAPGTQFILESYLADGEPPSPQLANYLSVESATISGGVHHFGISDRLPLAPPFRETGAVAPSVLAEPLRSKVLAMTTRALKALGVRDGITHTEVKLTPDGPRIIEVNGRAGGPIPQMYAAAADLDVVRLGARIALGVADPPVFARFRKQVAYWVPQSPAQNLELVEFDGIERIAALPGVVSVKPTIQPPARVSWQTAGPGGSTLLSVVATADSRDELYKLLYEAQRLMRPVYRPVSQ